MTLVALFLLIIAAFSHAGWNFLAKRAGGGAAFIWLFASLSTLIFAPVVVGLLLIQRPYIGSYEVAFLLGSAILHTCYFVLLQRAYGRSDLSLVYPIARGTGPLLTTVVAISVFGERPSVMALAGTLLILTGVFVLVGLANVGFGSKDRSGVPHALLIGVFIAGYTLWDKQAVSAIMIPPLLLDWAGNLGRALILTPYALRHRGEVRATWQRHARKAVVVSLLCPISYILVLTAMVVTPVSYVAPTREISILIGVALGTRFLGEGDTVRRLTGAASILIGVAALALG